ncbi:oxidoreductase [Enterococcus florum]|uniref:Oxidoreductase n=1 Tax=Enterococcus florum TaxID=2480627 RepID=A0A4P5P6S7_9ENTE|nr:aldo/keto reductase [Enterococcus florum]GCF93116.1 oxidoreductase [Enterococcus florum]
MDYVDLTDEVKLSRVVLGFWRYLDWKLSKSECIAFIEQVLDLGITTMDHADIYGDYTVEEAFGEVLAGRNDLKKQMQVVTKCGIVYPSAAARVKYYNTSTEHIIRQAESSLKKMQIEAIDVFLLHRPDWFGDPENVAEAFYQLKKAGKVKSFGVSNYLPHEFRMLQSYCEEKLVTNQVEASVLCMDNFENGTINLCLENRIHPMIWSPLAGGRIFTSDQAHVKALRKVLTVIQEEVGAQSIDEIAFAWLLSHPAGMIPITGSGEIDFVKKPVEALKYPLTPEQWYMIWTAVHGVKVP